MILITGASGFVGRHLIKALTAGQKGIRCLVREGTLTPETLNSNIQIIKGDLLKRDTLSNALTDVRQVVHLASVIHNPDSNFIYDVNVEGTRNLVYSCVQCGVEQFIFLSTLNVILPVKNHYSKSKIEAEEIIRKSGLNFTILRPALIYGKYDTGTIAKLIFSVKTKRVIFLLGSGEYKLQPVYIEDAVKAICGVLNEPYRFKNNTYFIAGKDIVSYNELIDIISSILGYKRMLFHIPLPVMKNIIRFVSIFFKNARQLKDGLETYTFNKVVDESLKKEQFPIEMTSLFEGLSNTINS